MNEDQSQPLAQVIDALRQEVAELKQEIRVLSRTLTNLVAQVNRLK